MERPSKAQRINALRGTLPHMTPSALVAICAKARAGELPDIKSRAEIREAKDTSAIQGTPFGPVVIEIELTDAGGKPVRIEVCHPLALIYAAARCRRFAALIKRALRKHPGSVARPWKLVIYGDGAKPGNQMKQDNRRAFDVVYGSFLDLGAQVLCKEACWLCFAVVRRSLVNKIAGGFPRIICALLRMCFQVGGHHLQRAGISLDFPHGPSIRLFAKLASVLADEAALHEIWGCKGSGGVKNCVECINILNRNWVAADDVEEGDSLKLYTKVFDICECDLQTAQTIRIIIDGLAAARATMSNTDFEAKQTRVGFNHNPFGLLQDAQTGMWSIYLNRTRSIGVTTFCKASGRRPLTSLSRTSRFHS